MKKSVLEDRVISLDEAARIAGISVSTLKRRAKEGLFKLTRMSARRVGVRTTELERCIEACTG